MTEACYGCGCTSCEFAICCGQWWCLGMHNCMDNHNTVDYIAEEELYD